MKRASSRRARRGSDRRRGQAAVEYMLMISVAVLECVAVSKFLISFMPSVFGKVECMINNPPACPWP